MLKITGLVIIVISISALGNNYAALFKKRLSVLEAFCELFDDMEMKISEFSTPVSVFFKEYNNKTLLSEFCKSAGKYGFENAIKENAKTLALEEDDCRLLCEFAGSLGTYSQVQELRICRYYKERLLKSANDAREKLPMRTSMVKSCGIMFGVMAAILLI